MPGFDGTGPRGMGPMTGGGRGFCNPRGSYRDYDFLPTGYGYPYRARPVFAGAEPQVPAMNRQQELDFLKNQAQEIRGQLENIEASIQRLENKDWPSPDE